MAKITRTVRTYTANVNYITEDGVEGVEFLVFKGKIPNMRMITTALREKHEDFADYSVKAIIPTMTTYEMDLDTFLMYETEKNVTEKNAE